MTVLKSSNQTEQMLITLKDNTPNQKVDKKYLDIFKEYSHKSLNKLVESNPDLLMFSPNLDNKDFYKQSMWDIRDESIYTNNLMGFVGFKDMSVRITSRFTSDANKDYFLHYMLQKVFLGQVVNLELETTDKDNVWKYYYYLFPYYLKEALNIGLYKEYVYKKYNNINVRGRVDIKRHIQKNIPFQGKIAYNTREHSYNNRITQLIRHTIEYILQFSFGDTLLNGSVDIRESVDNIKHLSPDYYYGNRQTIINDCSNAITNPYWKEYELLRKLCLKILKSDKLSFNGSEDKVHGILFDGAWLWEEYLATFIPKDKFIHPDNRKKRDVIYLAKKDGKKCLPRYPDFYSKNKEIVLDAKYKYLNEDKREDTHQVITYMYALKAKRGILIYPREESNTNITKYDINGYGGELIHMYHLISNEKEGYTKFCTKMKEHEDSSLTKLN